MLRAFILLCITALIALLYLIPSPSPKPHSQVIGGCWQRVRAELGLPPLPDRLVPPKPISRIELRKRKLFAQEDASIRAPLFLAPDALRQPSLSYQDILSIFAAQAALEERSHRQSRGSSGRSRRPKLLADN